MKAIPVVLILILFSLIYLLFFLPVFNIKELVFSGDQPSCTSLEEIEKESSIVGQNIILVKSPEEKIKAKYLCIRSAILQKSIPSKAKLEIKNRRAALTLVPAVNNESTESGKPIQVGEAILVDDEGVIFATDQGQSNQPLVYFLDPIEKRINQEIVNGAVKVISKLQDLKVNTDEPKIYSKNYLSLGQKPKITFKIDQLLDQQLASLQLILDQAKIDTKEVEFLDLRFDKPIVRYAPKK